MNLDRMYGAILKNINEALYVRDPDMNLLYINPAAERLCGYKLKDLSGKKCYEIFGDINGSCRNLCKERIPSHQHKFKAASGVIKNLKYSLSPFYEDLQLKGSIILLQEVSEDREAFEKIQDNFRSVFEAAEDCIYIKDIEFRYTWVNPAMEKLLGVPAKKLTGRTDEELLGKNATLHLKENDCRVLKGEIVKEEHTGLFKRSPRTFHIIKVPVKNHNNEIIGLCGICRDITALEYCEERLSKSERRYRLYMDNTPDSIFVTNSLGRFLEVNRATCKITGYSRDELLGMCILDLVVIEGKQIALKHFNTAIEKGRTRGEFQCRKKDGSDFIFFTEIIKSSGDSYFGYGRDITKSIQIDKDLIRAREFLHKVINTVTDPLFVKDEKHRWIILNNAYCNFMGYKRKDLLGKSDYDFFPLEEAKVFWEKDELVFSSGLTNENEESFTDASGKTHVILTTKSLFTDIDGKKVLVGIIRDITDQKRAEEERIRLFTAIEHAVECIIVTDSHGNFQYTNPAFETVTGYKREEVTGLNISILESDKHNKDYQTAVWDNIKKGEVWTGSFINRKKDGTFYEVEASISPIRNEGGNIINYVCVERDITDEKKLKRHLRQTQKMEAIGTLAGGIAHDFNNILAIIMGYTELALKDISEAGKTGKKLKNILKAGERGQELVKQILTFSRQRDKEWSPVRISLVIKEALNFLRASLPSTIEIEKNIKSTSGMILGDPIQIHQVIINLSTNASHAMRDKGGILKVVLENIEVEEENIKKYPDLTPGSYIGLTVSDTGHGMDDLIMERIFDPFFTTKKPAEGTGMGLAVVHGIVKSHKGSIYVTSEPGKGSTFCVMFPRVDSNEIPKSEIFTSLPRGSGRILFVDDEEDLVYLEKAKLEELGYEVIARTGSIDALEVFISSPYSFDIVITDQTMPHMTGVELARKLLKIRPDIPVIICTGFSELITPDLISSVGIQKYLMKPVKTRDLITAIRDLLPPRAEN